MCILSFTGWVLIKDLLCAWLVLGTRCSPHCPTSGKLSLVFRAHEKGCCAPARNQLCVPGSVQVTAEIKEKGHQTHGLCHEPPVAGRGQEVLTLNGQGDSIWGPSYPGGTTPSVLTRMTPQGAIARPPTALVGGTRRPSRSLLGWLRSGFSHHGNSQRDRGGWGRSRGGLRSQQQRDRLAWSTRVPSPKQSGRHWERIAPVGARHAPCTGRLSPGTWGPSSQPRQGNTEFVPGFRALRVAFRTVLCWGGAVLCNVRPVTASLTPAH